MLYNSPLSDIDNGRPSIAGRSRKIVSLQILRAIAASGVVVDHCMGTLIKDGKLDVTFQPLAWLLGWMGVGIFFVLSGLIMVRTSWSSFGKRNASTTFIYRRIIRIVPMYWLATFIVIFIIIRNGNQIRVDEVIKSLFFIPYADYGGSVTRPLLGQGWTLNAEMMFYVIFSASLLLKRTRGLTLLISALPALVAFGSLFHPLVPYQDPKNAFTFWTDPLIVLFGAGLALGSVEMQSKSWHGVRHPIFLTLVAIAFAAVVFVDAGVAFPLPLQAQAGLGMICVLCVALCTSTFEPTGLWSRLWELAGDASYSTYLFHIFFLSALFEAGSRWPFLINHPLLLLVIAVLMANVAGWFIYMAIEARVVRFIKLQTSR